MACGWGGSADTHDAHRGGHHKPFVSPRAPGPRALLMLTTLAWGGGGGADIAKVSSLLLLAGRENT